MSAATVPASFADVIGTVKPVVVNISAGAKLHNAELILSDNEPGLRVTFSLHYEATGYEEEVLSATDSSCHRW